jgi:hypothetical protein
MTDRERDGRSADGIHRLMHRLIHRTCGNSEDVTCMFAMMIPNMLHPGGTEGSPSRTIPGVPLRMAVELELYSVDRLREARASTSLQQQIALRRLLVDQKQMDDWISYKIAFAEWREERLFRITWIAVVGAVIGAIAAIVAAAGRTASSTGAPRLPSGQGRKPAARPLRRYRSPLRRGAVNELFSLAVLSMSCLSETPTRQPAMGRVK